MRFKAMGKRWLLIWVAKKAAFVTRQDKKDGKEQRMSQTDDGLTEAPWLTGKRVFLRYGLRSEKRRLEGAIHEFTHAADWSKDEEWVLEFGHDCANFLYALGVRFPEDPEIEPESSPEILEG